MLIVFYRISMLFMNVIIFLSAAVPKAKNIFIGKFFNSLYNVPFSIQLLKSSALSALTMVSMSVLTESPSLILPRK